MCETNSLDEAFGRQEITRIKSESLYMISKKVFCISKGMFNLIIIGSCSTHLPSLRVFFLSIFIDFRGTVPLPPACDIGVYMKINKILDFNYMRETNRLDEACGRQEITRIEAESLYMISKKVF